MFWILSKYSAISNRIPLADEHKGRYFVLQRDRRSSVMFLGLSYDKFGAEDT